MLRADQAIASLAPLSLHAKDEVLIYALDCKLIRPEDEGTTDAATLKRHVNLVLKQSQPADHNDEKASCQDPSYLWDSLANIVQTLSRRPSRRVILAVTDGVDRGSMNSWNALRDFAQERTVAIFGLVQPADITASSPKQNEAPFNQICQLSGGILLPTSAEDLGKQLARTVALIRGRYIVEFPRPITTEGGYHDLEISISRSSAFIRSTGIRVPTYDPAILNDPATVPSDPSLAPQFGNRQVLVPH
jgi:hypothetical protein